MEKVQVNNTNKQIEAEKAMLANSSFRDVCMDGSNFWNVSLQKIKISNANISDLEIEGAQLGGAFIHNIGMPPKDHPMYDPNAKMRPVRFEHCELAGSSFQDCDLSGVAFTKCNFKGATIDGVSVEELLKAYGK